jgi:Helicase conserved C-terminal domain
MMDAVADALAGLEWYSLGALKTMAHWRSDHFRDARTKAEHVSLLREVLFDPVSIRRALATCDRVTREALELIKRRDGVMSAAALRGQIATWHPELSPEDVTRVPGELVRRALAFWQAPAPRFGTTMHEVYHPAADNPQSALIFSAPEILDFVVVPDSLGKPSLAPVGVVEAQAAPSVLRNVLNFLRAVDEHAPRILRSGVIGARDRGALAHALGFSGADVESRRSIAPAVEAAEARSIDFFRTTLAAAGLLTVTDERQLRTTAAALRFSSLSLVRQEQVLLNAWLESGESELFNLSHLRCERRPNVPKSVPDDAQARQAYRVLIETLRALVSPGAWYDLDDLSRAIRQRDVEFLVSWRDPSPYHWATTLFSADRVPAPNYVGITLDDSRGRSRSLTMGADWPLVEGAFIRAVFQGPLAWLGLVECRSAAGGRSHFALTELGGRVLGLAEDTTTEIADAAATADALVVQPNFDVVVYDADERPELVYQVDRFAQRVSFDRLAIYRLTREALYNGLQLGLQVDDVLARLAGAAQQPLPQNVIYTLRDWARQFEEVRWVRNGWLLEAPDEATLDRWLADPSVQAAVERRLAPTLALADAAQAPTLAEALRRRRVDLAVVDANEPLAVGVAIEDATTVRVPRRDAHLYLQAALQEFAEGPSTDRWGDRYQLTRESVERAVHAGLTADQILDALARMTNGRLPDGMRVRVKGWAGAYPAVSLGPVAVFVAPDADTYRELRGDPELSSAFVASISNSAGLVRLDLLDRLRQALADRGIEVAPYAPPENDVHS